jgi:hypothetical protein
MIAAGAVVYLRKHKEEQVTRMLMNTNSNVRKKGN